MNFFKNKRIMIFVAVAIVITIILCVVIFSAIDFMGGAITSTSGSSVTSVVPIRFNFDKLKQIGIIKD